MRVLISGGCGLVGIHAARCFAANGWDVVCLDRNAPGAIHQVILADESRRVRFVRGDICNLEALPAILEAEPVDGVVHSAALINEAYSRGHPLETHSVNVQGTATVAEAVRRKGIERLVFTSSATVYGPRPDGAPIREDETGPAHVYGYSKYLAEKWLECYAGVYGLHCTIVRLSSVFGPGKAFNPDRYPKQRLCAEAIRGSTYRLPEGGDYARDFTYAPDVGRGIYQAYTRAPRGSGPYNIASGRLFTLREVADTLNGLFPDANLSAGAGRFEGSVSLSGSGRGPLDISRVRETLGFDPSHSLEDGLREYTDFLRTHPDLMRPAYPQGQSPRAYS